MRIDDRQLRFEDRLLLLFCEPRIVGLAAMTKPAWLNGFRHGEFPIFAELPHSGVGDGYGLAFDVRSKAFTRDSSDHWRRPRQSVSSGFLELSIALRSGEPSHARDDRVDEFPLRVVIV